jgi:hypothetical protein
MRLGLVFFGGGSKKVRGGMGRIAGGASGKPPADPAGNILTNDQSHDRLNADSSLKMFQRSRRFRAPNHYDF